MVGGLDRTFSLLQRCGAPSGAVRRLEAVPDLIRYLDLAAPPGGGSPLADFVVETSNQPLLFVRSQPTDLPTIAHLRRIVALRGDGTLLAVHEPGRLVLYDVALDTEAPRVTRAITDADPNPLFIPSLLDGSAGSTALSSRKVMFELLREVTDGIADHSVGGHRITAEDALSLAGRALFVRFLFDRGIWGNGHIDGIAHRTHKVTDLFADADRSYATCAWLDRTFNGDLLPLPRRGARQWFRGLPGEVFDTLTNVLHRAPGGQLSLPLGWAGIDFAHVPVGLLSEVYEAHCARHYAHATAESVHYTPRNVAEFMVGQSLAALDRPWEARVLDPAVGAGVFLVTAYRALVAARWQHDGKRPQRHVLRQILREQLAGCDINETALRLAALSLYLTALELDPAPTPATALRFDNLRGRVLFDVRDSTGVRNDADPGSLGPAVGTRHKGRYDLVVGNPPWTAWSHVPPSVQTSMDGVLHARGGVGTVTLADKNPDLAFLWCAMAWAREGGRIALAMSARLLFRLSAQGVRARDEILQNLQVTGIVNGTALRQTGFWPDVSAPFALLFAVNRVPAEAAAFWFVSPELDRPLNDRGRTRVDMDSARPVLLHDVQAQPWTLKSHFRGNAADREILGRLTRLPTLDAWWSRTLELHDQHQGYKVHGKGRTQQSAQTFHGLPDLRPQHLNREADFFSVDARRLPPFTSPTLLHPRARDLYRAPLVVVPKRIPPDRRRGRAVLFTEDVFFCESYHGWSCARAPEPDTLARYLLLLFNSDMVRYVSLLTSSQYGVERDVVLLEDIGRLPVRPLDTLEKSVRDAITPLADALTHGPERPWHDIDAWIAQVYDLSQLDREVIRDTLEVSTPEGQPRAQARPSAQEQEAWCQRVVAIIHPFLAPFGRTLTCARVPQSQTTSWEVLRLCATHGSPGVLPRPTMLDGLLRTADDLSATEVIAQALDGSVVVARVAQYRYWTPTRARLFATRLLQEHGDRLAGV